MDGLKALDKRENLKVVTDNRLIDAKDLSSLSLNARKLFYIAVSQCRKTDTKFYEYQTSPGELADLWGIDRSNIYREADKITEELMKIVITLQTGKKSFQKRHLFEKCTYDDTSVLTFKLHTEMTDLLLGLKRDFTQPIVWDFMKMRSPYSMALWHYFQKEMRSFKPMAHQCFEFDLTLEELRKVTGTETKLKSISEFKRFVLDKALVEIRRNCWVDITYNNIKRGRTVVGFRFTAKNLLGFYNTEDMPYRLQKRLRKAELVRKKANRTISPEELAELQELTLDLEQLTLEDLANHYPLE